METRTMEFDIAFDTELGGVPELLRKLRKGVEYPISPVPYRNNYFLGVYPSFSTPRVKDVIFNNPATIVYWNDGTKTVVKCDERDTYSKEAGLALCYMKKMLGSSRSFNDVLKEWTEDK